MNYTARSPQNCHKYTFVTRMPSVNVRLILPNYIISSSFRLSLFSPPESSFSNAFYPLHHLNYQHSSFCHPF